MHRQLLGQGGKAPHIGKHHRQGLFAHTAIHKGSVTAA
jgi:hypothetical protein